ncbi:Heavy metal-associated isoprenylated plant protein 36 [Rhynchospora pubera]|uniref:Heavy metal-associated isoprenylated plant protein 36 n=1 Tax=Rhynchospora pubera TaxID=906938 RepID=A0AAV8ENT7_9POAL|nr:Heavy metal-associated isoprenylated plant protein 36 [Rhynchospora pubera]KAJ4779846.1 Heavy metal-associated isoprenylated plant protein 36 [Rhynchospora pubera]
MASLIFKERKGMNFSCTSPASTAVCTSIDRRSIVQPSSSRYLDRYTPHLRDPLRSKAAPSSTKSLPPPPLPPPTLHQKTVKQKQKGPNIARRSLDILMVSAEKISPPVSSRYLLNSERFSDVYAEPEPEPVAAPPPLLIMGPPPPTAEILEECTKNIVSDDSKSPPAHVDKPKDHQVVELRVSLHCKGCQAKVKKHLSKMEGVASFNIDFVTKKVTVIGDVTPLGVLNSISKVKNAQFWPSPPSLIKSDKVAS